MSEERTREEFPELLATSNPRTRKRPKGQPYACGHTPRELRRAVMLEILLVLVALWFALRSAAPYVLGIAGAILLVAIFGSAIPRVLLLPLIIFVAIEGIGIMKGIFRGSDDGQMGPRQPMQH